jgi:hypothetical protein
MNTKPILYGYQAVRLDTARAEEAAGLAALRAFAQAEGYALSTIFVERDVNRPCSALAALIAVACTHEEQVFVAVPRMSDLGRLPRVQALTSQRIERESGARVLLAQAVS